MRAAVRRRHLPLAWTGLGLAGSLALSAAASQILSRSTRWWFVVPVGGRAAHVLFWAGLVALCAGWLGLGLHARAGRRELLIAGGLWAVPLLLGPALFSHDMYSYLAQGDLLRLGVNPYQHGPAALGPLHQSALLAPVSPIWQHTTAPYGPLFVGLTVIVTAITGTHLVAGVLLVRALELPGLVLLAIYVPRLARALGADPDRATWLVVCSPLVLVQLVGGGHNDALMAGLLVAGVTLAVERRPAWALALCTAAALIKLPAAAAIVFVVACWLRESRAPARVLGTTALIVGGVTALVGLATGVGISWLNGSLLSTPGKVHLAITPSTAIGYTLHSLLGAGGSAHPWEAAAGAVLLGLTAVVGAVLLWRVDYARLVPSLGILLLGSVLAGPAAWPWYLAWALVLPAVMPAAQTPRVFGALATLVLAACAVIGPGGTLSLHVGAAPTVLAVYVLALGLVIFGRPRPRLPRALGRARSVRIEVAP